MAYDRNAIILARQAFLAGAAWICDMNAQGLFLNANAMAEGRRRYPMPKITRPRVITDSDGYQWRAVKLGFSYEIQWRNASCEDTWANFVYLGRAPSHTPTVERCKIWLDLLEHPNEEVEDDDG